MSNMEPKKKDNQHSSILQRTVSYSIIASFLIIHKCYRSKAGVLAARGLDVGKASRLPCQQRWYVQLDAFTACGLPSETTFISTVMSIKP